MRGGQVKNKTTILFSRPENRGLHESMPDLSHYTVYKVAGRSHAVCNVGSKSLSDSILDKAKVIEEEKRLVRSEASSLTNSTCEQGCDSRVHIIQVRHPLQRLISIYRWTAKR